MARRQRRDRYGRFAGRGSRRRGGRRSRRGGGMGSLMRSVLPLAAVGAAVYFLFLRKAEAAPPLLPATDTSAEKAILDAQAAAAEQAAIEAANAAAAAAAT